MARRSESDTIRSGKGVQGRYVHDSRRAGAIWRRIGGAPGVDEVNCQAGDLTVPARPNSGMDMRQGPSGPGPRSDTNHDEQMDQVTIIWRERETSQMDWT